VIEHDPSVDGRLDRMLAFLAVSGGAALLCKRTRRLITAVGEVEPACVLAALDAQVQPTDAIISVTGGVVAEVGLHHRLFIQMPASTLEPRFLQRIRRAREIIERFALYARGAPPAAPPTSAPAHAVVFPEAPRRR
jgi:hypothetical protein